MNELLPVNGRKWACLLCCCLFAGLGAGLSAETRAGERQAEAGQEGQQCNQPFESAPGSYDFVQGEQAILVSDEPVRIRKIHITRLDVFDESNPKENNRFYRLANRIHILTREDIIKRLLLFREGDLLDERLIRESERLLRAQQYLYDADIRPVNVCEGEVELEVIARDVWSLTVDASIDRAGGETDYSFGLRNTNMLGRGAAFSIRREEDSGRDATEFFYNSRNFRGSRIATHLAYTDLEDGSAKRVHVALPFYALDVRRAWTLFFNESDETETQYFRGKDLSEVRHDATDYLASYGFSKGIRDGRVDRWSFGVRHQESSFRAAGGKLPPPASFPGNRKLTWPFLQLSIIEDRFQQRVNLDQIYRTEDINTGYQLFMRMGVATEFLGSDADRAVVEGNYSDTLIADEKSLLGHRLGWQGYYNLDGSKTEDMVINYALRYLRNLKPKVSMLVRFEAVWSDNLNTNRQIVLGGNTGARAFDNHLQTGDRKVLLTLERRHFTDYHFLNLIRMGWVAFMDAGRAWDPDVPDPLADDYLANLGLGLRLASSKSDVGRFLHLDLAFPLTNRDDRDVDSYELSVRVTSHF